MKTPEILKELREFEGLSQQKLADLTGISQSAIARWELGQAEPTASGLRKLSDFFKVSVDELLGRTNDASYFDDADSVDIIKTEIQELYDNLTPAQQQNLLNYARGMAVSNELAGESTQNKKRA